MRIDRSDVWRAIYGLSVLVVFGLLLVSIRPVLSPVVLFLLLVLLLTPYAGTRGYNLVFVGATAVVGLWLLRTTGFLLAPFILALVLAYIFDPAVDWLERRRVPRGLAVALLGLPGVLLLFSAVFWGGPALAGQVEDLIREAPLLLERAAVWIDLARLRLLAIDVPGIDETVIEGWFGFDDPADLVALLSEQREALARRAWSAVLGLGSGIRTVLTIAGYVFLTPVLTFYLLRDYDGIAERVRGLIPVHRRDSWLGFGREVDVLLSRYLRGQLLVAIFVGVLTGAGLWLLRFPYPAVVGAVAGVFNLVPYLGLVVSLVPAVIIALLSGSVLASLLKIALVFAVVQIVDSTLLGPRIVGGSVGLHPVVVLLALTVGGFFFGFVGLLIAVPVAVVLKLLARRGLERYRRSRVYGAEA